MKLKMAFLNQMVLPLQSVVFLIALFCITTVKSQTVGITIDPAANSIVEDIQGNFQFNINVQGGTSGAIFTAILQVSGDAESGVDFQTFPVTVSGPLDAGGNASITFPVQTIADNIVENNEQFTITITSASDTGAPLPYPIINPASASATIVDDDNFVVSITAGDSDAQESTPSNQTGEFMIDAGAINETGGPLTVDFIVGGTAVAGDYNAIGTSVQIPNGQQMAIIPVIPNDDNLIELDESVMVTISNGTDYTVAANPNNTASVIITENDVGLVTIDATDATASEAGLDTGTCTVDLGGINGTGAGVTVNCGVVNGNATTATLGDDFTTSNLSVVIPDGAQTATITLTPEQDNLVEGQENVRFRVNSIIGDATLFPIGTGGNRIADVTIDDDDSFVVSITASDATANENTPSNQTGEFTIDMGAVNATGNPVMVNFTVGGTAGVNDYATLGTGIMVPNNERMVNLMVVPEDDDSVEVVEDVIVTLSNGPNYVLAGAPNNSATVTINDNDEFIAFVNVVEDTAQEGVTPQQGLLEIDLGAVNETGLPVTVNFALSGSADEGVDFTPVGLSRNVPINSRSVEIPISPIDDLTTELLETVTLALEAGAYTIGMPSSGTVNIIDDDAATLSIDDIVVDENQGAATFTVTLNGMVDTNFTVSFSTGNILDTALPGSDYTAIPGSTLNFTGNDNETQEIDVTILDDRIIESTEDFTVSLATPSNLLVTLQDGVGIAVINDDDECAAGTSAPTLNTSEPTAFCDSLTQDLDNYVSSGNPPNAELRWSTDPDTDNLAAHLSSSVVMDADTYYGFYFDALNECASPTLEVTLVLNTTPSSGMSSNVAACSVPANGNTIIDLDDQLTDADLGGVWSIVGTPSGASVTFSPGNIVNFTGLPDGNYVFEYTTNSAQAPCTDPSTELTITVTDCSLPCNAGTIAPQLDDTQPTNFCDTLSADLNDYVANTAPSGTVLTWSTNSDPLVLAAHRSSIVNAPGSYFGFFFDDTNNCASPTLEVVLVINRTPQVLSTSMGIRCGPGEVELSATVTDGGTLNWFDVPSGGTILGTGSSFTTPVVNQTTSFYVEATANGCTSERIEVVATVENAPVFDVVACNVAGNTGPTVLDLDEVANIQNGGLWSIVQDPSGGQVIIEVDNNVNFEGLADGIYVFGFEASDADNVSCEESAATITVSVTDCAPDPVNLSIQKESDKQAVLVGESVIFTLTLTNESEFGATDIVVEDIIAVGSGFEYLEHVASSGEYNPQSGLWAIGELTGGEVVTLQLIVRVTRLGTLQNTASIIASSPIDIDVSNNTSTVQLEQLRSPCEDCGTICNLFSPNGDGINDFLILNCDQNYPNNTLQIFDRYGNNVVSFNGYNSTWDGTGNDGDLAKGTYFYILDLGDGSTPSKGWIQIIR